MQPVFLTSLTTTIGFLSMNFSDVLWLGAGGSSRKSSAELLEHAGFDDAGDRPVGAHHVKGDGARGRPGRVVEGETAAAVAHRPIDRAAVPPRVRTRSVSTFVAPSTGVTLIVTRVRRADW